MYDWVWVYGTLVRNAGWTFAQCDEQPADQVFEFLAHLAEHPPEYLILAWVHLKPKSSSAGLSADETEFAVGVMGAPQPLPAHIAARLEWAESFGKPK